MPGFPEGTATAINASGDVVGYGYGDNGPFQSRAFLYSKGTMTTLNPLSGYNNSEAYGINATGDVVGYCYNVDGERTAFLYRKSTGKMIPLPKVPGYEFSRALGINASGQIVGEFSGYSPWSEIGGAFLYSGGDTTDLDTIPPDLANNSFGDFFIAYGINDSEQVVGEGCTEDGQGAVLYDGGDITLVCESATAYGINAGGQVVGQGYPSSSFGSAHAFLYTGGDKPSDLGTMVNEFNNIDNISAATGINDKGEVVGWYGPNGPGTLGNHAFVYSGGQVSNLPMPTGGFEAEAYGINANGWVVGAACYANGVTHAVIWQTPTPTPTRTVDLVVTDFTTEVHNRVGNDADRLDASVTVMNAGTFKSKAFDITFYARKDTGPYTPGDLILTHYVGPALNPGKSITLKLKIRDPVYLVNPFTNGYYLGVQIDPKNKIAETNEANNFMQVSGVDPIDLGADISVTLAASGFFLSSGFATASQAVEHYLDNTVATGGTPIDWGNGTDYSNEVKKSPEFSKSVRAARSLLIKQLTKSYNATGSGFTKLDVPTTVIPPPEFESKKDDLYFTMHGTQGSSGEFSGIQVTPIKHVKKNTVCTFVANLSIKYTDVYEFDAGDATKGYVIRSITANIGSCMRHLQMCGWAKPFNDSVTAIVTVSGQFTTNRTIPVPGSREDASGAISDIMAPVDVVAMANAMGPRYTRSASGRILSAANDAALLAVLYQPNASA